MRLFRRVRCVALLVVMSVAAAPGWARDGDFVSSFGVSGRTQIGFSPNLDSTFGQSGASFNAVAVQPGDGKIVIISSIKNTANTENDDFGVLRLNPNGTLDTNFGGLPGGQAIIAFDNGGNNNDDSSALALDAQGNILVAGTAAGVASAGGSDFAITRLTPAGLLDTSFAGSGKTTIAFDLGPAGQRNDMCDRMILQTDGKILMVGNAQTGMTSGTSPIPTSRMAIVRLASNGVRDTTFNGSGRVTVDFGSSYVVALAYGVVQQSNGAIVMVGTALDTSQHPHMVLARLTSSGVLDSSFGNSGILVYEPEINGYAGGELTGVLSLADNSLVVSGAIFPSNGGNNTDFFFAKFSASSALDPSFGNNGQTVVPFDLGGLNEDLPIALKVDSLGRYVAAGVAYNAANYLAAVVRLTADGNPDPSFGTLGTLAYSTAPPAGTVNGDQGSGLAFNPDGSLIVASLANYDGTITHLHVGVAKLLGDTVFSNGFEF